MTEKRAYAVVRVSSAGTRWLEYETGQFALVPFEGGDEVEVSLTASEKPSEIRPRVAPGEEWRSPEGNFPMAALIEKAVAAHSTLHELLTHHDQDVPDFRSSPLCRDLLALAKHLRAPLAAAPEGQEVAPGGATQPLAATAAGQEVPSGKPRALPGMNFCWLAEHRAPGAGGGPCYATDDIKPWSHTMDPNAAKKFATKEEAESWIAKVAPREGFKAVEHGFDSTPPALPEEVVCDELDEPHAPGSSYCRHPRPSLGTCSNFWHPGNGRDAHARRAAVGDLTAVHADHVNDSGCLNWKRAPAPPPDEAKAEGSDPRPAHPPSSQNQPGEKGVKASPWIEALGELLEDCGAKFDLDMLRDTTIGCGPHCAAWTAANMGRVWKLPKDANPCRAHSGARTVAMLAMREPVSAAPVAPAPHARSATPATPAEPEKLGDEELVICFRDWHGHGSTPHPRGKLGQCIDPRSAPSARPSTVATKGAK